MIISSCNGGLSKCEKIQEWNIEKYKIVKSQCPDLVLSHSISYSVYVDNEIKGSAASKLDSCKFNWQADNEQFITFNVCKNKISVIKPNKIFLNQKSIDSISIFSNSNNQAQRFTSEQINIFVNDWNNSKTRGYSTKPFDSAFSFFPSYQYKLTIFSKGQEKTFYGYNFLILDSSNWKYEMSKPNNIDYFHKYWKK